jgi:hemerythrin HHE cation binding domain-containing protein
MNALDLLRVDHQRISNLFQQVDNEMNPQLGQAPAHTFAKLAAALRSHKQMLVQCLYPDLEPYDEMDSYLALDARTQKRVDELVASIEDNQPAEQSWTNRLTELRDVWQTHVEQSENRMFPEALRLLGATRLQQLEFDMDAVRTHQSDLDSAIYPASRLGPKT